MLAPHHTQSRPQRRENAREIVCDRDLDWLHVSPHADDMRPLPRTRAPVQGRAVLLIRRLFSLPLIPLKDFIPRLVSEPLSLQWPYWQCFQAIHWGSLILPHTNRQTCSFPMLPQYWTHTLSSHIVSLVPCCRQSVCLLWL